MIIKLFLWNIDMKKGTSLKTIFFIVIFICMIDVLPLKAEKLDFCLMDSFGRKVSSQDYEGVPIFLEFGACW